MSVAGVEEVLVVNFMGTFNKNTMSVPLCQTFESGVKLCRTNEVQSV